MTSRLIKILVLASALALCLRSSPAKDSILDLPVSGYPVDGMMLKVYAIERVYESLDEKDRYYAAFDHAGISPPKNLKPGESVVLCAPFKMYNAVGRPAKRKAYLIVRNIGVERAQDDRVMVSNDPEVIGSPGTFLSEKLNPSESVRLLYYHKGAGKKHQTLKVSVHNPNPYEIALFTSRGLGGPCADGIYAGHKATRRFLRQERADSGRIIKIPPYQSYTVAEQELKDSQVSTGIIKLRQLTGRGATVTVTAGKHGEYGEKKKEDGRLSGVLDRAYVDISESYSLGEPPLNIRIGESPTLVTENKGFDIHRGNYGLMHRIKLDINNPSGRAKKASIFYVASGGPTRGIFMMGNSLYETGLLDPKKNKSEKIMTVTVPSGGTRTVSINMMPQPGSFYPTRFVLLEGSP